jgi:hypothetical protein
MGNGTGIVNQVPVTADEGGLYEWKALIGSKTYIGHVVVRGVNAAPINGWSYAQGTETWYSGTNVTGGATTPTYKVKLTNMAAPDDAALIAAITTVRNNETLMGSAPEIPTWTLGAPLGTTPTICTLTQVTGGLGSYGSLYQNVSMQMKITTPQVMPTWYTSIANLGSIFGDNPGLQVGIEAKFVRVKSGNPGYPSPNTWYWCGRNPT